MLAVLTCGSYRDPQIECCDPQQFDLNIYRKAAFVEEATTETLAALLYFRAGCFFYHHQQPSGSATLAASTFQPRMSDSSPTLSLGVAAQQSTQYALPTNIGKYRIIRLLWASGMGAVCEAEQEQPRRSGALKPNSRSWASPELLLRFEQESQGLGRLHPGRCANSRKPATAGRSVLSCRAVRYRRAARHSPGTRNNRRAPPCGTVPLIRKTTDANRTKQVEPRFQRRHSLDHWDVNDLRCRRREAVGKGGWGHAQPGRNQSLHRIHRC